MATIDRRVLKGAAAVAVAATAVPATPASAIGPGAAGESFQYTFTQTGEYFFNDQGSPRSTGKVEVY